MDSGFEALPARSTGAHGRKRKLVTLGAAGGGGAAAAPRAPARASHAYNVITDADAVAAEAALAPVYDSAAVAVVQAGVAAEQPGGVEGSDGLGKWEYLDHTADVQVHTCASRRAMRRNARVDRALTPAPSAHTQHSNPQGATRSPRPSRSRRWACGRT